MIRPYLCVQGYELQEGQGSAHRIAGLAILIVDARRDDLAVRPECRF